MPTTQNLQNPYQYAAVPGQMPAQMPPAQTPAAQNSTPQPSAPVTDWSSEISTPADMDVSGRMMQPMYQPSMRGGLDLRNRVPDEFIESPTTVTEAYLGSMKSMLARNRGNFVVATFLIGTQGTTTWEGILYEVGSDFLVIHQAGRDRFIACDIYSLKYIEFYDTQRGQNDIPSWQGGR